MDKMQDIRMRARQDLIIGFCLSLFSMGSYLFTYHFSSQQLESVPGDLGPAFFPRLFLLALLAVSIFIIVSSLRKMAKIPADDTPRPKLFQGLPFVMLILFMLYICLSLLVGYIPATIIYLGLTFYILGVRTIWQLATIPPVLSLVTYYLFQGLLDIYLPTSCLF
ncbi:MAG: tripartite tricarboxylate transporter TctB family protein [Deltaproteobacteria bacterium]|nr:tripartite tricarboxylate transporter TctB family protein [Deltaproteobacteria bacterium]